MFGLGFTRDDLERPTAEFSLTILLVLLHGDSKKVIFKRFIVLTVVSVAVVAVGHKFMPPGSRAMFIEAITEYELKGHDAGEIKAPKKVDIRHFKFPKKGNYWDSSYLTVFDVRNNRFSTIENVFKSYIFSSDRPEYETTKTLHEDISNRTKKYVITKKKNIKFAGTYFVHRDRSFLWTAAINEWRKNTITARMETMENKRYTSARFNHERKRRLALRTF